MRERERSDGDVVAKGADLMPGEGTVASDEED